MGPATVGCSFSKSLPNCGGLQVYVVAFRWVGYEPLYVAVLSSAFENRRITSLFLRMLWF
jgi:hypothetical protein